MFDYPTAGASAPAVGVTEKEGDMSLKKYDVTVNGFPTTVLLSDADAKEQGLFKEAKAEKAAESPAPAKKAAAKKAPAKKAATPANKARTAANKQG